MSMFSKPGHWPSEYEIDLWARSRRRRLLKASLRRAAGHIADLMQAASHRIAARRQRLKMRGRLPAMDDRLLADIGLTRGEIEFALSGARRVPYARRDPPSRERVRVTLISGGA